MEDSVEVMIILIFKTYTNKMSKNGEWGGDIEIIALCKALSVNVVVF